MKKLTVILMSAVLTFSLAACGSNQKSEKKDAASDSDSNNEETLQSETSGDEAATSSNEKTADAGDGKTLVVYYSATGNTESVANNIAAVTNGNVFELEPKEPYTDEDLDWTDDNSRVSREHENEDEREVELVTVTPENWESYDTVFIGYPIWWGIAAWPVDQFVKTNDFTGKTVIPFCTSASSGLGESGELLEKMAKTGDWQKGARFSSGVSEDDVREWVEGLDL